MTPTASSPAAGDQSRDLQREALRLLVELSNESAATEKQIEQRRADALAGAKRRHDKAAAELAQQRDAAHEQVRQRYEDELARINAEADGELEELRQQDQAARNGIADDFESAEAEAKQKYQQASWLAESVYEGTMNQVQKEAKTTTELFEQRQKTIEGVEVQANQLVVRYGQSIPPDDEPADAPAPSAEQANETYEHIAVAQEQLANLRGLAVPKLFIGARPYLVAAVIFIGAIVLTQVAVSGRLPTGEAELRATQMDWRSIGIAAGASAAFLTIAGAALWFTAKRQVRETFIPLRRALLAARTSAQLHHDAGARQREQTASRATRRRNLEIAAATEKVAPLKSRNARNREAALRTAGEHFSRVVARVEGQRSHARAALEQWRQDALAQLERAHSQQVAAEAQNYESEVATAERRYADERASLERDWNQGLRKIEEPIAASDGSNGQPHGWDDPAWRRWVPPGRFATSVRFGELGVDLKQVTDQVPQQLALPKNFSVPAALTFPRHASLLIHTDHQGRAEAIRTLQMVMARLLTSLPAGRVRFTIIDPVGLGQNFAGFMHLADHDEALVGGRIWTEADQIEERLANLTEHMETVIQKYLRNEFATIDEYNEQAGELAEPYRFLVIADFPVGFQGEAFRRLNSIASTGAKCGVYTLVVRDTRQPLPSGTHLDELEAHCLNLVREGDHFTWRDDVFSRFPLTLDPPPAEQFLTTILDVVGKHAKQAKRVEVPFDTIAPPQEKFWTGSTAEEVSVPIGRMGATRLQSMKLGRGVAQHVLMAGKTGSGKSTLMHAIITNLAMWYSPDEIELYLVDFKKGVEFKTYGVHQLPHARAIAVESDREFGLSVLQRIDAELGRRGALFRQAGVQDLASYRKTPGAEVMPRTLLIIDEFQEFFSEDDRLAQDAGLLLDRLVRQGRAFGIHLVLGSQTIGGTSGLARSTIGQMAVRIALQTSEADSQLILGDNNAAARLLSRPGEAIYNDQGGLVEGNSPFQVAWLPDDRKEQYLAEIAQRAGPYIQRFGPPIVFEGNAPADIRKNAKLMRALDAWKTAAPKAPPAPQAWLGDPVAIKDPTAITFRRQSGANALIVGQSEDAAMAMIASSMISLAAQHGNDAASFYLFDATPADSPLAGTLARVADAIPHKTKLIEWRATDAAIAELAAETKRRMDSDQRHPPAIFLFIYALQRYRQLRKSEDSFSFGSADEDKPAAPDKQFAELLREGPAVGIHVIAWADTPASVERTLDRNNMREFDTRILFQMSASDSSNLIDSPLANKLGMHRALAYSEEQGIMEKFRPYALPDPGWLEHVGEKLR
ncbi:MAG TPA: FtsK/SpoIIIE domain-containing protein [Tepidisphaeraceae bacterium]|nr:FtsK/SpoIIIE domain-containing protein [Tepidisphaeraceae bacterium]